MKQLTKVEEEIMQILWKLKKDNVGAILEEMPEPKRAYNTVSTMVRILESKGFVDHEQVGKGYLYYPLVEKEAYINYSMKELVNNYFDGSFRSMILFYMKKNNLDSKEIESLFKEFRNYG